MVLKFVDLFSLGFSPPVNALVERIEKNAIIMIKYLIKYMNFCSIVKGISSTIHSVICIPTQKFRLRGLTTLIHVVWKFVMQGALWLGFDSSTLDRTLLQFEICFKEIALKYFLGGIVRYISPPLQVSFSWFSIFSGKANNVESLVTHTAKFWNLLNCYVEVSLRQLVSFCSFNRKY